MDLSEKMKIALDAMGEQIINQLRRREALIRLGLGSYYTSTEENHLKSRDFVPSEEIDKNVENYDKTDILLT